MNSHVSNWFVLVQNQAYGPYSDAQMAGFVAEGRITASSLISNLPDSGYQPAGNLAQFAYWQSAISGIDRQAVGGEIYNAPVTTPAYQMQSHQAIRRKQNQQRQNHQEQNQKTNVFMIVAEIRSDGEMAFLQALQSFGPAQRISDTNWLVRSGFSGEQIRNKLSQTLNRQDRLFVLDTKAGKAVWFNIGADLDHRIRELFDEDNQD